MIEEVHNKLNKRTQVPPYTSFCSVANSRNLRSVVSHTDVHVEINFPAEYW